MKFKLYQAVCAANYAVGQMVGADFSRNNHMDDVSSIVAARKYLMDSLDALSAYQAEIDAEAKAKVAA